MLAPHKIPAEFLTWNKTHHAPFGRENEWAKRWLRQSSYEKYCGPFAVQANNSSREFEYPWAFHATPIEKGQRVLEIGGGLSGFQFLLDKFGCKLVNVDPGLEREGIKWHSDEMTMAKMNKLFGTSVELRPTVITEAELEIASFDRVFSISVLEHLPEAEIETAMKKAFDCLKAGGYFILTIDLFLDTTPFTSRQSNVYGTNVDVKWITEIAPFALNQGNHHELFGFDEFDADRIQSDLSNYLIGMYYPTLTQCLVLQKPNI
jgi:hypothetical protein